MAEAVHVAVLPALLAAVCVADELPAAAVQVAQSADVLEVIFEHCGLLYLDSLKLVCRLWRDLACALPERWATASIA